MREIEFRVLAGILPDAIGRIETATLLSLGEDNFQDRNAAILWGFISEYYDDHSAVIPEWVLVQKAEKNGLDSATQVVLSELHRGLSALPVEEHEFKEAVKALKERELEERTAEVLTIGREILVDGYHDPSTDTTYRGHDDARSFVSESLQKLQVVGSEAAPEGEMRDDMEKIWKAFVEKADNPDDLGGIKYGLKDIDEVTGGIRPGELCLLAGFTGVGKSHIVVNLARNAMLAGKNVLMFTTETTREEMELRILARHSREPKFKRPRGLDSHEIMSATLSAEDTKVFREVLNDFRERAGGSLFMVQMPSSGSTDYVYAKANQYNRKAPIDLIIIDSINLLRLPRRYDSKREMLEDMLQAFKRFASAFDNGRGVGIASPWQMSRTAWKEAEEAGGVYSLASLADTSEAERCLPLDTGVLTPFGFVPIGSLVVGDTVVDPQGNLQSVQEIHDPGELPLYKVTTSDSFSVLASPGHVWDFTDEEGFKDSLTTEAMAAMLNSGDVTVFTLPELSSQADYHSKTWADDQIGKLPVAYMVEVLKNTDVQAGQLVVPVEDPQMVTDYIRTLPRFAMIDDVEEPKHVRFHYDAEMLKGEPYFEEVMRCNLLGGDPSKFKLDPYYLNLPRIFRLEFIERFLGVYGDLTVDLTTKKDQRKYLPTLPYDHPSYGESLKEMVLSLGFTLDGEPRRIVSIEKTGTSAPVRCITVSGSLHEFIIDGFIPTHNSASQIITLYKEGSGDNTRLSMQVLKHRSGRELPKVTYPVDYRNSFIDTEGSSGNSADTQPAPNVRERGNLDFRSLMG